MAKIKPILFNTPMVIAIIAGIKTQTRRLIGAGHVASLDYPLRKHHPELTDADYLTQFCVGKYQKRDNLYVRETWGTWSPTLGTLPKVYYRADGDAPDGIEWRPSIHMPKELARIFLRVTDVRAERLKSITTHDVLREGCSNLDDFIKTWNDTINPAERERYSWWCNPWVWVYTFEQITAEEARVV